MLIDGVKWACGRCVRGHRVSTCEHHDRPLVRIKRKGRPFATCPVCNETPCPMPREHYKLKDNSRIRKMKSSSKKLAARVSSRLKETCLPLAPRPSESSDTSLALLPPIRANPGLGKGYLPVNMDAPGGTGTRLSSLLSLTPGQQQQTNPGKTWEASFSSDGSLVAALGDSHPSKSESGAGGPSLRIPPITSLSIPTAPSAPDVKSMATLNSQKSLIRGSY